MMREATGKPADSLLPPAGGDDMLFGLDVNVGRYLPDWLQPVWAFLQDHPLLLVIVLFVLG
ncbi:MAG: hypothetical protein JJ992_16700, partial [Planctomycetes bacterium]|nr:hypothetical protein [Planctomycetota bacterium]